MCHSSKYMVPLHFLLLNPLPKTMTFNMIHRKKLNYWWCQATISFCWPKSKPGPACDNPLRKSSLPMVVKQTGWEMSGMNTSAAP